MGYSHHRGPQYCGVCGNGGRNKEAWAIYPAGITDLGSELWTIDGQRAVVATVHSAFCALQFAACFAEHVGTLEYRAPERTVVWPWNIAVSVRYRRSSRESH